MEPTSFNVGDVPIGLVSNGLRSASMEPTSFNVGDGSSCVAMIFCWVASMEPTSFNVGDHRHRQPTNPTASRLQWSRRLSTSETQQ